MKRIIIAGAGTAGHSAATELRKLGYDDELIIVGAEVHDPYRRPPLSKEYLVAHHDSDVSLPRTDRLDASWRLGQSLTELDVSNRTVVTSDGGTLGFDGLVIATGTHARALPSAGQDPRVLTLRGIDDARRLRSGLDTGQSVVIVGAGFLGSELAGTFRALGKDVSLVERDDEPLLRPLGADLAQKITGLHREHGVDLHLACGVRYVDLEAAPNAPAVVELDCGKVIAADLVVAALGAVPATAWLDGSGLDIEDGVLLDDAGWAASGVTAAGDVARVARPLLGGREMRIEHHSNALSQGIAAARTLLGKPQRADVPSFWTEIHGVKLRTVGFTGADYEYKQIEEDPGGRFLGEYHHEGRLIGAVTSGMIRALPAYHQQLLQAIP